MKRVIFPFVMVLIILGCVAISPLLINEKGYILIAMGDLTIESTVVTGIIMLVLLFIALLFTLKVFKGGLSFSLLAWNKVAFANRRRATRDFNKGVASYILEDYPLAEKLLAKTAHRSPFANISYLMAASAAQKQDQTGKSQHYLDQIVIEDNDVKTIGLDAVLVRVQLYIKHQDYDNARQLIDQHHKHVGHDARLLALEIDLCLIEKRFEAAIQYLVMARKEKEITVERIAHWEDSAFYQQFFLIMQQENIEKLNSYWNALPRKVKQSEAVIFAYCQVLAENTIIEPIESLLLAPLKKDASALFLKKLRHLPLTHANSLMALVHKQLHKNPQSGKWLSTLAHLAFATNELTTSEKAFTSLLHLPEPVYDEIDLKVFAQVYQAEQKYVEANKVYQKLLTIQEHGK